MVPHNFLVFSPLASYTPPTAARQQRKGGVPLGADLSQVSITLPLNNPRILDAHTYFDLFANMTHEAQDKVWGGNPPNKPGV